MQAKAVCADGLEYIFDNGQDSGPGLLSQKAHSITATVDGLGQGDADMTNNLFLGADAQIRHALQLLRAQEGSSLISGEITGISDDIFFSNDPEANVVGEYQTGKNNLISLKMQPDTIETPRWQALHLRMGPCDLSHAGVVGFVIRSQSPAAMITRACLRSGRDGQFVDTFFTKAIASFATPSTHLDAIDLDATGDVPRIADWREFILFFRPGPIEVEFLDLRPFVV